MTVNGVGDRGREHKDGNDTDWGWMRMTRCPTLHVAGAAVAQI